MVIKTSTGAFLEVKDEDTAKQILEKTSGWQKASQKDVKNSEQQRNQPEQQQEDNGFPGLN